MRVGGLAAPNPRFDHFPQKGMTIPRVTLCGHSYTSAPSQNRRRVLPVDVVEFPPGGFDRP